MGNLPPVSGPLLLEKKHQMRIRLSGRRHIPEQGQGTGAKFSLFWLLNNMDVKWTIFQFLVQRE